MIPSLLSPAGEGTSLWPHLILGGARSGKSHFAEQLARTQPFPVRFLATATPSDAEMAERIAQHRRERPSHWQTVEVPYHLSAAIGESLAAGYATIVDCLTVWCSNWLLWVTSGWTPAELAPPSAAATNADREAAWHAAVADLLALCHQIANQPGTPPLWLVANEVGLGIVPADPLSRRFRDEAGRLNQALAAAVPAVTFVVAGIPWPLKSGATIR